MLRAVLDANIYVSAAVTPDGPAGQILSRFVRGEFEVVMSPATVDEIRRVLAYRKVKKSVRTGMDTAGWFSGLVLLADLVENRALPRTCPDADDDKVLAAAIEGRAEYVVTGDGPFLALGEVQGVRILTPRAFLALLRSERREG